MQAVGGKAFWMQTGDLSDFRWDATGYCGSKDGPAPCAANTGAKLDTCYKLADGATVPSHCKGYGATQTALYDFTKAGTKYHCLSSASTGFGP